MVTVKSLFAGVWRIWAFDTLQRRFAEDQLVLGSLLNRCKCTPPKLCPLHTLNAANE